MNTHGGYFGKDKRKILDFSVNLNPLGVPESVKDYIIHHLDVLDTYPEIEARTAREHLAVHHGLKAQQIMMGNGAVELIYLLARTFKPKKVLILQPTFNEYERAFKQVHAQCEDYFLKANMNFELDVEDLLDTISTFKPDIMALCNPNNPTGSYIDPETIEKIVTMLKAYGGILLVDESFLAFEGLPTALSLLHHGNLILLRSMTKFYAIAGIRLGYALGSEKIMEMMKRHKEPWTLNTIACDIVEVLLKDTQYPRATKKWYDAEKEYFRTQLKKIPFLHAFDSSTNFFLCRTEQNSEMLKNRLLEAGIYIRTCNDFTTLENRYIRLAVRSREENQQLFQALEDISDELRVPKMYKFQQ